MNYIIVALIAWVLFGLLSIVDKFLLNKPIKHPNVYTFYTGLFSLFAMLLFLPFARYVGLRHFLFDILCGIIFLLAQYFLFVSVFKNDVSEVVPITGALIPIFSLIFVNFGLHIYLTNFELLSFIFLVLGTVLISYNHGKLGKNLWPPIVSSVFFAAYYVMVKVAYTPFASNFAYVRMGSFVASLFMLLSLNTRKGVFKLGKKPGKTTSGLFVSKEILAGVAFIILNYAISFGNPAIINALEGVEYVTIFVVAIIFSVYFPKILREDLHKSVLMQKIAAILLIAAGIIFLQVK